MRLINKLENIDVEKTIAILIIAILLFLVTHGLAVILVRDHLISV
jgi:hypothetical protein